MQKNKKRTIVLSSIKSSITWMIVATLAVFSLDYLYVRLAPTSFFFEYASITNVAAEVGKPPTFYSVARASTLRQLKSQEEIICLSEDGLIQFGEREVTFTPSAVSSEFIRSPVWSFANTVTPNIDATCHVEANISMQLRYGISKHQFVTYPESSNFIIKKVD